MHEHNPEIGAEPIEHPTPIRPRIYVASLADYVAGRLHGAWLDATADLATLQEGVQQMLADSAQPVAEEYAIHDYEGFGDLHLSEYEPLERVVALAQGIAEHGPAFGAWWDHAQPDGDDLARLGQSFDDAYRGNWASTEAYVDELLADLGATEALDGLPDWLQPYVRLASAALARDMVLGGDLWTSPADDGVHVFDGTADW